MSERIWNDPSDPQYALRHDPGQGMAETDKAKFDQLGRDIAQEKAEVAGETAAAEAAVA